MVLGACGDSLPTACLLSDLEAPSVKNEDERERETPWEVQG